MELEKLAPVLRVKTRRLENLAIGWSLLELSEPREIENR